ncbi:MAG TPA: hypothetical protein VFX76_18100, partial [Roseiflexaceae bacterium]|nr:hypothetical protein [Roseiflexaceae bacterium]
QILVADEDELEQARELGFIRPDQHRRVLDQQRELIEVLRAHEFDAWLGPRPDFDTLLIPPGWLSDGRYVQPGEPYGWPTGVD